MATQGARALRAMDRGRGSPVGEEMALSKEVRKGFFALCLSRKQPEKVKVSQEVGRAQAKAWKCGKASCVRELRWPSGGWGRRGWHRQMQSLDQEGVLWQWVMDSRPGLGPCILFRAAHSALQGAAALMPRGRPGVFAELSGMPGAQVWGLWMLSGDSPPLSNLPAWLSLCPHLSTSHFMACRVGQWHRRG